MNLWLFGPSKNKRRPLTDETKAGPVKPDLQTLNLVTKFGRWGSSVNTSVTRLQGEWLRKLPANQTGFLRLYKPVFKQQTQLHCLTLLSRNPDYIHYSVSVVSTSWKQYEHSRFHSHIYVRGGWTAISNRLLYWAEIKCLMLMSDKQCFWRWALRS